MNPTSALSRPILLGVARKGAVIVLGVALITLCAKIRVPSWPVPMTLHTLAVMAIALAAGPRLATAAFMAYLMAGAAGVPVFSGISFVAMIYFPPFKIRIKSLFRYIRFPPTSIGTR